MRRWLTSIVLTAVLVAAVAFAIAGCGGEKRTIPTKPGQSFLRQLDKIGDQFDNHACNGATDKVDSLENQARSLPSSVDPEVKRNLVDGIQRLRTLVQDNCQRPTPTNTAPTTVPTAPTQTQTVPTTPTETTPTVPTTPTETTPTAPSTTPTTPPPTTTPGEGGGVTVPGVTGGTG